VENTSGVLSRVAGLFSRRGYNIDSLTVGVTQDPTMSRMTIVAYGDDQILDQIKKQLSKLEDVKQIVELPLGDSVCRELVLVKVESTPQTRASIIEIADIFRAKIIDVATESLTIEITGEQAKLQAFTELLLNYNIKEIVRTGLTGLMRGNDDIHKLLEQ
jgi:acetolactate synthase-1/3 small subunit